MSEMSESSSTSSQCDAQDSVFPGSNRMRSTGTQRNFVRAPNLRFGPAHKGRAVLNLAAKRWREMSPEHRALYRKPTCMFVPVEPLGVYDLEPPYECGVQPEKRRISKRKALCGKVQSKRSKSSGATRRRRKSAVAKKSKREAKKSCAGKSLPAKAKKPKKPKTPKC